MRWGNINPSIRFTFFTVVITELSRNLIASFVHDPQINIWREIVDDFEVNLSIAYTVKEQVLRRFAYRKRKAINAEGIPIIPLCGKLQHRQFVSNCAVFQNRKGIKKTL